MDFEWDPEPQRIYDDILARTAGWLPRTNGFYTREKWRQCAELGLLGLPLPKKYGGSGLGALTTARVIEAFGRGCTDMGLVFGTSAHLFSCAVPIAEFASDELRSSMLPRLANGDWIAGNAITEDGAGSDVNALQTKAVPDGDGYLLAGTKSFVSNGPLADVFIVYAMTNPEFGHLGISAFLVDRHAQGVSVGDPIGKTSLASCPASTVSFDDCWVPAGHRIGAEGCGAAIFQRSMHWERTCLLAGYVGMMDRALEHGVEHARARHQFGSAIGRNQAVSHRLVDAKLRLESARLLLWRACWQIDHGRPAAMSVSLAKLAISESAIQMALDVVHLFGGKGISTDGGLADIVSDAMPSTVFSGTSEMQREIVAKEMGL